MIISKPKEKFAYLYPPLFFWTWEPMYLQNTICYYSIKDEGTRKKKRNTDSCPV